MRVKLFLVGSFLLSFGAVFSQNEDDALRYSLSFFGGTARNSATAGGLTALGGDFANASQNPAGLGRLTKSNFSFTQNLEIPYATTNFYGSANSDFRVTYNLSNISYVKAYTLDPDKFNGWRSLQMGLGMNRKRSYNDSITYSGIADSSILHSFIREANGISTTFIYDALPFTAGLAYDTYAIDPLPDNTYTTQFSNGTAFHERRLKRKGGITEFSLLTLSGNYANKLLLGGSVNFVYAKYSETFRHKETYQDTSLWLNEIEYTGQLDIKGRGLNLRLGAIYMPTEQLRFGLAVETPTALWMNDYWTNNMTSQTKDGEKYVLAEYVPTGAYDYKIRTPFKANVSAAAVVNDLGSVGVEVEYIDYRMAKIMSKKFSDSPYSFAAENTQIDNIYKSCVNIKFGIEGRINKQLYARGGFAYYGTPYKAASGNSQDPMLFITGGAGYNFGTLYIDMAYVLMSRKEEYYAYDPTINGSHATFYNRNSQVLLTIGARF
ncbi:MAG: outer membrane protein transport protein [Crocinitomicaceae bacterium]|nr:outer membrane protein transport protein [Crocinitomicaceae bacterium]